MPDVIIDRMLQEAFRSVGRDGYDPGLESYFRSEKRWVSWKRNHNIVDDAAADVSFPRARRAPGGPPPLASIGLYEVLRAGNWPYGRPSGIRQIAAKRRNRR
jgi:hypothetical protein